MSKQGEPQKGVVIGLCGAEGAGKTTMANVLVYGSSTPPAGKIIIERILDPRAFVLWEMFRLTPAADEAPEPIWKMTYWDADKLITGLMHRWVDPSWTWRWCRGEIPIFSTTGGVKGVNGGDSPVWTEVAFADTLKKVVSILFDVDYTVLLGRGEEERVRRETEKTKFYSVMGSITLRRLLEYFGTDVMRSHFDSRVWIKILQRRCSDITMRGDSVVISDIRFINEKQMLLDLGGWLIAVYRDESELVLDPEDHLQHPAKWEYKLFIKAPGLRFYTIQNSGTLLEFVDRVKMMEIKLRNNTI